MAVAERERGLEGAPTTLEQVRVRVLGPFEVEGLPYVGSRKARTLLKMLSVARGQPVSVDRLALALWGDSAPRQVSKEISVLVSRLRSVLGARSLLLTDAGYRFAPDWLDLAATIELARHASEAMLSGRHRDALATSREALSLFRGPLLMDEADAEWAETHRVAAGRLAAQIRQIAGQAAVALGELDVAAELAAAQLEHDPYDEVAMRVLMGARAATGRRAVALAAYAQFRSRLREELGTEPSAESDAIHTAILRGDPIPGFGPAARPAPSVEADVEGWTLRGRDRELEALREALTESAEPGLRMVGLCGEPAMGKSRLLEEWCRLAERQGANVVRISCGTWSREAGLLPLVEGLGPYLSEPDTWRGLVDALERAGAAGLVVMAVDDLHLASPALAAWLQYAARHATRTSGMIVVTSRPRATALPAGFTWIHLGGIDEPAAAGIVGGASASDLVTRTGGNPGFMLELARDEGARVPSAVAALVEQQMEALGGAANTVRVAALIGMQVDLDQLTGALGLTPADLLRDLEVAMRLGILVESGSHIEFRSPVLRDALLETTPVTWQRFVLRHAAPAAPHFWREHRARREPAPGYPLTASRRR
jgi:DNA-binding SARP family transcriptional activator